MRRRRDRSTERAYEELKAMAVTYALKPGQRINAMQVAKRLGVSPTPLREALTRLTTEGLVRFVHGQGFYIRELNRGDVSDLYELRKTIELSGLSLAVQRAEDADIAGLQVFLQETGSGAGGRTDQECLELDETFHERLIEMSKNKELARVLRNVNERIRFIRWVGAERASRPRSQQEHEAILAALLQRDQTRAVEILDRHISRRLETIVSAIKESMFHIYMGASRPQWLDADSNPTDLAGPTEITPQETDLASSGGPRRSHGFQEEE